MKTEVAQVITPIILSTNMQIYMWNIRWEETLKTALAMYSALVGVNKFCDKNTVLNTAHQLFQSSEQSCDTAIRYQIQFQLQNRTNKN